MSTHQKTRIKPLGKERKRLMQNIGQESWVYTGAPIQSYVVVGGKPVDVWVFQWRGIPKKVQEHMIRARAQAQGCAVTEAHRWLETHPSAIPCAQVELIAEE